VGSVHDPGEPRALKTVVASMLALPYVLMVALVVVAGFAFGWRIPIAVALFVFAFWLRVRVDTRWPKSLRPNQLFVALDLFVSGMVGAIVAGLLFGGVFTLLGFVFGAMTAISSIPLSTKSQQGGRVPLTLQNSPSTAKTLTVLGFLLPVFLLAICLLVLFAH
jgi:hypothetical protein